MSEDRSEKSQLNSVKTLLSFKEKSLIQERECVCVFKKEKTMRLGNKQIRRMVSLVLKGLKEHEVVTFKQEEEIVFNRACELVLNNFKEERNLDQEVNLMMDDLESKNPGGFERYKMFPLLKKRLAKQKGIIL